VYRNDFSVTRIARALNVITGDGTGNLALGEVGCQSVDDGTDPNCVPWDIFTPGGVTDEALAYLQVPLLREASTTQQNVIASVTGELGLTSPAAESPVQVSLGLEYRRDELDSTTDAAFTSGDGAGQGGPTLGLQGDTDVFEIFGEARIPLIEGAAFAELLSVDLAYRYSDYASGNTTDTYKVGLEWSPTDDIRFRGSYQQAIRAPNVIELFAAQGAGLFNLAVDPCDDPHDDGVLNDSIPANCIGVAPHQVTLAQSDAGGLLNPAGQYNGLFGGNPDLNPEESTTTTFGLVFTPTFVPGLNVSIDYFDIEVTNLITATGVGTLSACYAAVPDVASCALIQRNANGQLWRGASFVQALNTNIGGLHTRGYDINANYNMDIGSMGGLSFQLIGTLLEELEIDEGAATGRLPYDCAGLWSGDANCGTPNPEWRHRFRISWETPWNLEANLTWRYFSSVHREQNLNQQGGFEADPTLVANQLGTVLDEVSFFDLAGNVEVHDNTNLRFGVNNILDQDPPISTNTHVGAGFGNGNTFPQVYDATGRFVFVGVTVDF
jgi:outer membrane receptor protein involved in Fe transport